MTIPANTPIGNIIDIDSIEPLICDLARSTRIALRAFESVASSLPAEDSDALLEQLDDVTNLARRVRETMYTACGKR
jgi:hypothetical protein